MAAVTMGTAPFWPDWGRRWRGQFVEKMSVWCSSPRKKPAPAARVCEALLRELRPNRILGYHNIPGAPVGTVLLRPGTFACASLGLAIEVEGQQSHAAYPEQGKNPAYLLSEMVLRLPELIAQISEGNRERLLMATVVQLKVGERNFGVSAGTGALALTLRGNRQEDLEALEHSIVELVQEGCASRGCAVGSNGRTCFLTPSPIRRCCPGGKNTAPDRAPTQVLPEPMRWSEDFGWYLHRIPGVYLGFGAEKPAVACTPMAMRSRIQCWNRRSTL